MTGKRRWWWRLAGGVLAFAAIELAMTLLHGQTDELRLALVVALVVCAAGLLVDATPVQDLPWGRFTFFSDPDGNAWSVQQLVPQS